MQPNQPHTTQQYVIWFIKIGQLLTTRLNRSLINQFDITFNQVRILFFIAHCSKTNTAGSSPRWLAQHLQVSLPNVTALIRRLQSDGYVAQTISSHDRRAHNLKLTTKGKKLLRTVQQSWPSPELAELDHFFKTLPSQQRKQLSDTLTQLTSYLCTNS